MLKGQDKVIVGRIVENINQFMFQSDIRQSDLRLRTGIERSTISRICRGEQNIKITDLIKIAAGLNITLNLLVECRRDRRD